MTSALKSFADLLAPIELEEFFDAYWEREPLHVQRSDERFYSALLTAADVEAAISSGGLRHPAIQLARSGGFYPPEAFTRTVRSGGDLFTGVPDLERIRAEYLAGATISLPGFHRAWRPLAELAATAEAEISHPVHANVYVTPAGASGFAPHYDTHEVFVLQIAGSKRWRIERSSLSLPHRAQPFDPSAYAASDPVLELELELAAGDLLYLPRGYIHSTSTTGAASVHVTLGVTVYTWADLLAEWAQLAVRAPALREALPPGFAREWRNRRALAGALDQAIEELRQATDFPAFIEAFAERRRLSQGGDLDFQIDPPGGRTSPRGGWSKPSEGR